MWSTVEEEEFLRVKSLVSDIKTLNYYDVREPLLIECDASCFGLGVAVFQKHGIIGYASRTLTETEKLRSNRERIVGNPLCLHSLRSASSWQP